MLAVTAVFAALFGGWTGLSAIVMWLYEVSPFSLVMFVVIGCVVAVMVVAVTLVDSRWKNLRWFMAGFLPVVLLGFFLTAGDPFSIIVSLCLGTIPGVQLASARSIWRDRDATPVPGQKRFAVPVHSAPWICLLLSTAALGMVLRIVHIVFIKGLGA